MVDGCFCSSVGVQNKGLSQNQKVSFLRHAVKVFNGIEPVRVSRLGCVHLISSFNHFKHFTFLVFIFLYLCICTFEQIFYAYISNINFETQLQLFIKEKKISGQCFPFFQIPHSGFQSPDLQSGMHGAAFFCFGAGRGRRYFFRGGAGIKIHRAGHFRAF